MTAPVRPAPLPGERTSPAVLVTFVSRVLHQGHGRRHLVDARLLINACAAARISTN